MARREQSIATKQKLIDAAARLLAESGEVSTRDVCEAAGVTAPTLYHYFGDKEGLIAAVAADALERYLASKRAFDTTGDPIEDLRVGWDNHVEFGLQNPVAYGHLYGRTHPGAYDSTAEAEALLSERVRRVAETGLLRVSIDEAKRTIIAANAGVTLALIARRGEGREELSPRVREAVLASVIDIHRTSSTATELSNHAVALQAALRAGGINQLSPSETALMLDWLERLT